MHALKPALAAALACVALLPVTAAAQANYPDKPIRLVVPFAPGGALDLIARTSRRRWAKRWARPSIVDNKPGAGARSAPNSWRNRRRTATPS